MLEHIHESPFKLWEELTKYCIEEGMLRRDDENAEIIELLAVPFHIKFPLNRETEIERYCNQEMIANTIINFTEFNPKVRYKYRPSERIFGKLDESPYNKIKNLLIGKPESKKATISILKDTDLQNGHVPCIVTIDFKVRDGLLNLYYFARSQDVFKRSYADNIALAQIQKLLAAELDIDIGILSGYIASAHIYKSDLELISSLKIFKSFFKDKKTLANFKNKGLIFSFIKNQENN
jgi:thymidylate synthase